MVNPGVMTDQENAASGEEASWVPFTLRLPPDMHDWLRHEAFFDRTTMAAIVREEITARRARSNGGHLARYRRDPPGDSPAES